MLRLACLYADEAGRDGASLRELFFPGVRKIGVGAANNGGTFPAY